ncbi:MAG: tRNA adenosine(34) deaminase TadA [Chloroflexota bacterium]
MDQLETDIYFMRLALAEAQKAADMEEVPVGAIAVYQGEIVGRGYNRKESDTDPTAHAEMLALREAAQTLGNWRLLDVTLYCTLEPCPMCAGAMIQARLPRLVYGAADTKFGADGSIVSILDPQPSGERQFNHHIEVTRGILADEALSMLQVFFQLLREKK